MNNTGVWLKSNLIAYISSHETYERITEKKNDNTDRVTPNFSKSEGFH